MLQDSTLFPSLSPSRSINGYRETSREFDDVLEEGGGGRCLMVGRVGIIGDYLPKISIPFRRGSITHCTVETKDSSDGTTQF